MVGCGNYVLIGTVFFWGFGCGIVSYVSFSVWVSLFGGISFITGFGVLSGLIVCFLVSCREFRFFALLCVPYLGGTVGVVRGFIALPLLVFALVLVFRCFDFVVSWFFMCFLVIFCLRVVSF